MIKFSLLICIYAKENPVYFQQCLDSLHCLTVMPDEIVVVKDGPLPSELEEVLSTFCHPSVNIISLPENVTLGPARAIGVEAACFDWIAVMDSDDICRSDRFEKQLSLIESDPELSLIGGQIAEFVDDPGFTVATRFVPTEHDDIVRFAKTRSPFNHMTVMFRRDTVLRVGNYRLFPLFEDYDLWTRLIKNGTICANHPDVLVDARVGRDMFGRRRGIKYVGCEWRMQRQLLGLGLINGFEFLRNVILRIPVRLLPGRLIAKVYGKFVRTHADRLS
ncbi:MAG: glycosyltransferase [Oscillospiraceae bacterium]|jgi:GT2 family glycosyltransferase|nr:glycosyltransferase [Oscillospiraceae bacterium]